MKQAIFLLLMVLTSQVLALEPIQKVVMPTELTSELTRKSNQVPKEIEGKVWNRWTSENFTVLSLNDVNAQYLHKHLELVKAWIFSRWGLVDLKFTGECKLICVDDPVLFNKLFRLTSTKVEVSKDDKSQLKRSTIFLLVNDAPSSTVPVPLTEICLAEFAQKYDAKLGWWAYRGMALLNGSLSQIRDNLREMYPIIEANKPLYFSKSLFEMTKEQYLTLDEERRRLYDDSAVAFCLLLRQEFGQDKFHWFIKVSSDESPEIALKKVLGFDSYAEFDRTLKRYIIDLVRDVQASKTPAEYLQVHEKKP